VLKSLDEKLQQGEHRVGELVVGNAKASQRGRAAWRVPIIRRRSFAKPLTGVA
jgi:hypothetical protein